MSVAVPAYPVLILIVISFVQVLLDTEGIDAYDQVRGTPMMAGAQHMTSAGCDCSIHTFHSLQGAFQEHAQRQSRYARMCLLC